MKISIPGLALLCLLSGCIVSETRFNDLERQHQQLSWTFDREKEKNDALQTYIDLVLQANVGIQRPILERKGLNFEAYQWKNEAGDRVYPPYYVNPPAPDGIRVKIAPQLEIQHQGNSFVFVLARQLIFEPGSVEINAAGKRLLNKIADELLGRQDYVLRAEGHCDPIEVEKYTDWKDGWQLSVMRAVAVTQALEAEGIPSERLIASGRSSASPQYSGSVGSETDHNRRVELIISPSVSEP